MLNAKKILIIAAHPDDEVLGAGGVAALLAQKKATVKSLILGQGVFSRPGDHDKSQLDQLRQNASKASRILGAEPPLLKDFPDNRFDQTPLLEIVQEIEKVKKTFEPDMVLTHHAGDLNVDHSLTNRAVLTAFRPLPGEHACAIYAFEVLSSTEYSGPYADKAFLPTDFVDISSTIHKKLEAMKAYSGEIRKAPHPRSLETLENLSSLRGSQVGLSHAEAFMLIRKVHK